MQRTVEQKQAVILGDLLFVGINNYLEENTNQASLIEYSDADFVGAGDRVRAGRSIKENKKGRIPYPLPVGSTFGFSKPGYNIHINVHQPTTGNYDFFEIPYHVWKGIASHVYGERITANHPVSFIDSPTANENVSLVVDHFQDDTCDLRLRWTKHTIIPDTPAESSFEALAVQQAARRQKRKEDAEAYRKETKEAAEKERKQMIEAAQKVEDERIAQEREAAKGKKDSNS